jgi:tetratricopeptide (TPR) repeat protein
MDAQNLCRQAAALHQRGRSVEAERLYLNALAVEPNNPTALNLLGVLRAQAGRRDEGQELILAAIRADPGFAGAHLNLAILLEELGRPADALKGYSRALELKPELAAARFSRGNVLNQLERHEEALADYDWLLARGLADAALLNNRGSVLRALGRADDALASFGRAAEAAPGNAAIWKNHGNLLREQDRYAEALASYDRALALDPDDAESWDHLGVTMHALRRFDEAMSAYDRAISVQPGFAAAWFHKALELLIEGKFAEGWPLLEWRRELPNARRKQFAKPVWQGEDIAGKTLFVWWEEGLGDAIMFYRFCIQARAMGAHVVFSAPDILTRLFKDASADVEIIGAEAMPKAFDFHIPLLSLPLALKTRLETIPRFPAYLRPGAARIKAWKKSFGSEGFRIGVVWAATSARALGRSFPLAGLEAIARLPGVRLISLQKQDGLEELSRLPAGMAVETFAFDEAGDAFLDTAAMMANMDLVITADTSTAHLAGALGCRCWLALKYVADWRWFLERDDSPWYPATRLFRQKKDGDWSDVFARMKDALGGELPGQIQAR